jgi:hypothetical protein
MGAAAAQEGAKWERRRHKREQKREQHGSGGRARGSKRGSNMGAAAAQEGAKEGATWERRQHKREQNGSGGSTRGSKMGAAAAQEGANWEQHGSGGSTRGSRGEQIAGLLGLGSVFLVVFHCGGSFCGFAVYRDLVLLYDRYLPLMSARYMLALTSATPGMPYAVHMRALGMSTSGRSRSRVKPAVGSVRTQVALTARVSTPPTRSTAAPRMPRYPRRPACARDLFFLMLAPHGPR